MQLEPRNTSLRTPRRWHASITWPWIARFSWMKSAGRSALARMPPTLAAASTQEKAAKAGANVANATSVGKLVADRAKQKSISKVVFDRGGFQYMGKVKALADAAREAGLEF